MNYHAGRLVYNYNVIVLIHNVERNILGLGFVFLRLGNLELYLVALL